MQLIQGKSALVIFDKDGPKRKDEWWQQFEVVVAPKEFEARILKYGLSFVDISDLIDPGSVQEAAELARKLSLLKTADGRRLSKVVNYKGFELWWIHYDDLMSNFCLPYTQYARLLDYLKNFPSLYFYKPLSGGLFQYFLNSYGCKYVVENEFTKKLSFGILLQVALSIPFLLWVKIRRPKLMVWSSDLFDPPRDHDFRMKFIYEELQKKEINFVEFIRSMEPSTTVLQHALKRKRPVIYSFAIGKFTRHLANILDKRYERKLRNLGPSTSADPLERFQFEMATSFLHNVAGDIWSIRIIKYILNFIGIKVAIIPGGSSRNFHEVLACKLSDIKIVGIQHGASPKHFLVSEFMPEFDGEKHLSVDMYGLWSDWWKEYYIKNGRAYKSEQLCVSGPMRPLQKRSPPLSVQEEGPIKVLFVSEPNATPSEAMSYLLSIIDKEGISPYLKFRPYHDRFEEWLKKNHPEILKKVKIIRGDMHDAIAQCDVVIGSYSTGVLEAPLLLKPFIFFQTKKWGDYFELKSFDSRYCFFAENPQELIELVRKSKTIPKETLEKLQRRFFGDPYINGSKWVVEQVEKLLKDS